MTLEEIKSSVDSGVKVFWQQNNYEVQKTEGKSLNTDTMEWEPTSSYDIVCTTNGHRIGLTWRDGVTLNAKEEDFYKEEKDEL